MKHLIPLTDASPDEPCPVEGSAFFTDEMVEALAVEIVAKPTGGARLRQLRRDDMLKRYFEGDDDEEADDVEY